VALARAPEAIAMGDILKIARGDLTAPSADGDAVALLLQRRDWILDRGLEGITLRSLLEEEASPETNGRNAHARDSNPEF
jgi:hypothetical protein